MGNNIHDRAEGTSSGDASGNPSAAFYLDRSYAPTIERIASRGFSDARTGESGYLVSSISYRHLLPYLSAVESIHRDERPTIREAHNVLTLDRRYQATLFKYIGIVESKLRAQYSHWMELLHGSMSLYDENLFNRKDRYRRSLELLSADVERRSRQSRSVRRALKLAGGKIPIDLGVECATLGTLTRIYANTADRDVTTVVATSFGCSKTELSSWMKTLTDVRNVCAHFGCYITRRQIPSTPLKIRGLGEADAKGTFYAILILLRLLTPGVPFPDRNLDYAERLILDIETDVTPFESIHPYLMKRLGFNDHWREQMRTAAKLFGE